jgi:signal transduction histidine kinase
MEVLRNVSHELATPMTPILGYSKLLINGELGALNGKQLSVLQSICESGERLKGLITNLLDATRFATGAVLPEYGVENPQVLLDLVAQECRDGVGARVVVEHCELDCIRVDTDHMAQAFRHLLSNAIKFGPEDQTINIRSWTESVGDGDVTNWVVSIEDEGPGIPLAERDRVVEPFYQIDGSTTRAHAGAGLGLSIASQIIRTHGGSLSIGDSENRGAILTMRVPTVPGRAELK